MAKITPFKALRPTKDKAHLVASRSVVSYSRRILNAKLETNPYSFLHIIKPEFFIKEKSKPNSVDSFKKVKQKFDEFRKEEILVHEEHECYYIYQQIKPEATYTGIIAGISIDDYIGGNIKVHEQTLTKREKLFEQYLDVCGFNAEPVLLTYQECDGIETIMHNIMQTDPLFDYSTTDRVRHKLWKVEDSNLKFEITQQFSKVDTVYIADGHHRSASSSLLGQHKREQNPNFTGNEGFNYILSYLIPETQLDIYDFNRLVKDTNRLTKEELLNRIADKFEVEKQKERFSPTQIHEFSMYLDGNWYKLNLKLSAFKVDSPVDQLDSSILTKFILDPILNIKDLKTNRRIYFKGGTHGMKGLESDVNKGRAKIAFGLFPVTVEQMKLIADTNNIMPPKTTWIEPKLRSGLTIFEL